MSWLFGIRKDPIVIPDFPEGGAAQGSAPPDQNPPKEGAGSGGSFGGDGGASSYRFDSSALERAAKAARELEMSPHAKHILDLTKMQERNKELAHLAAVKQAEERIANVNLHMEQAKSEQIRIQAEERRKTISEETKHNQQRAQYQDQLARKRYEEQLVQQQRVNEEERRKQEESVAKQEAIRRATIEKELEKRAKIDMQKIEAEVKARGRVERENQDLLLEQIRQKAAEDRKTQLDKINAITTAFGSGFSSFISDWDKVLSAAGGVTIVTLGYFTVRRSTKVLANYLEAILKRPKLIKEFYGFTAMDFLSRPIHTVKRLTAKSEDTLKGVILHPALEERLSILAMATRNAKRNKGYYMNMLLHGPPGTGKTLFARRLAQHCGMNCAIMSGADIGPMGKNGVLAIHKLFDYASAYRRGLLIFIDEADAFLKKRKTAIMSEDVRSALNAFLARTGEKSDKYMIVLASNAPNLFDDAVNDRINASVEFSLPGPDERERLVRHYFDQFILIPATEGKRKLKVENFDYSELCSEIAKLAEGFSGREISNMASMWQASAYETKDGILTRDLIMKIFHQAIQEHKKRLEWQEEDEPKNWPFPFFPFQSKQGLVPFQNKRGRQIRKAVLYF